MERFVNKASMYTSYSFNKVSCGIFQSRVYVFLCYVDMIGGSELFQSRLQCICARAIFLLSLCLWKSGFIYTRFLELMCWRKRGMVNFMVGHNLENIWLWFRYLFCNFIQIPLLLI